MPSSIQLIGPPLDHTILKLWYDVARAAPNPGEVWTVQWLPPEQVVPGGPKTTCRGGDGRVGSG